MASVDWGSVPAWVSAVTPLILAGVITRAMNRTTATLKEALRSRPRSLRTRLRSIAAASRTAPPDAAPGGHHHGGPSGHHDGAADGADAGGE